MKTLITPRSWAVFLARVILGLIFFAAGFWKVFRLGAVEHARNLFVLPYESGPLPEWSLWFTGVAVPWVELLGGALMLAGWKRFPAAVGLGAVLMLVTFGHLLAEPLYAFNAHVVPRAVLLDCGARHVRRGPVEPGLVAGVEAGGGGGDVVKGSTRGHCLAVPRAG